jgi:hypothetical protein
MSRPQRTRRARWAAAAVAALAMVGGGLFVALPADAATTVRDGFEGNPYFRWQTSFTQGDSYVWLGEMETPNTGSNAAHYYSMNSVSARSTWSLNVDRPSGGGAVWCYGEAMLARDVVHSSIPGSDKVPEVRMRVRAGGPSGRLIIGTVFNPPNHDWRRASFATFPYEQAALTVEIVVTNGIAGVDDVSVRCVREIS